MATLKDQLTTITGVENWESINFSILPGEDPKGYYFVLAINPESPSRQILTYGVGIAFSATSITDLNSQALSIGRSITTAFSNRAICSDEGVVRLTSNVEVEPPQSYPQQSNVSLTTGFFTALTFTIEVG